MEQALSMVDVLVRLAKIFYLFIYFNLGKKI